MEKTPEEFSKKITDWIGSTASLIIHTIFFIGIFALRLFGVNYSEILLVLTTIVSLEAIYLAIFIQITVNRHSEDLEELSEDVEEIQKDVDEIQEDFEELSEEEDITDVSRFEYIEHSLQSLLKEIQELKKHKDQQN